MAKAAKSKTHGRRKKKKTSLFWPIYLILVVAALIGIFMVRGKVLEQVSAYEASLPVHTAESVAQVFLDRDFEKVYAYQNPADFPGETAQTYAEYMNELTRDGELTWREGYAPGEDARAYSVRLDGKRLFEFNLARKTSPVAEDQSVWVLDGVRTLGVTTSEHTVTAPSDCQVFVGDRALSEENVVKRDLFMEDAEYLLGDNAKNPSKWVYRYETCFSNPTVRVVDARGRDLPLSQGKDGGLEAEFSSDDELKAEVEERVVEIVKAFANFTSEDLSQARMLRLVRKGTNGYEKIEGFENDWFGRHAGYDFENMVTDNYARFSEDTFACDISFDYIIKYSDADDIRYPTNYRFYFVERDDQWYLYDFRLNN